MANGNKTFVKITNQQVYNELCALKKENTIEHEIIKDMIEGYKSQVSRLQWSLGGISVLTISILAWFISYLSK
jgi:hypothetical protein